MPPPLFLQLLVGVRQELPVVLQTPLVVGQPQLLAEVPQVLPVVLQMPLVVW